MSILKIILDTDPGGDDIFAFFWLQSLLRRGFAELVAVTTAAGNVSARKTFSSASQILSLGKLAQVEIGRGVAVPNPPEDAAHIHGNDGMGNLSALLPTPVHDFETARDSDEILIDRLNSMPGEITIVAIAPLTNLASAELKHPGILQKAKEIIIMGGAFHCPGNITSHAEFNLWFNPLAAEIVLNSRDDLVITSLDITQDLVFTRKMALQIYDANSESQIAQFLLKLCEFMIGTALQYRETQGIEGFLVHDAATLGYLFYPETMLWQRSSVQIETQGKWTRGQTLIDDRHSPKPPANAWIATQVNAAQFFTSLIEDLKVLVR
ncbi:MAG: nucleoside hydrolase [Leptolyngbya sp. Prado105]|jgi:inosine-uridine nucleoside N-ribohydrolase|nr:nucleoside hydrolase [Leptolyngbya sp. Prado105]